MKRAMRSCSDSSGHVLSAYVSWLADMRGPVLPLQCMWGSESD